MTRHHVGLRRARRQTAGRIELRVGILWAALAVGAVMGGLAVAWLPPHSASAQMGGGNANANNQGLAAQLAALSADLADTQADLADALAAIVDLQNGQGQSQSDLDDVKAKLAFVSVADGEINGLTGPHLMIEGCNVHIRSGSGQSDDFQRLGNPLSGLGNLVVGYNEDLLDGPAERTGSHNLIVGWNHSYTSWGCFVAGDSNTVSGVESSVTGGIQNVASYDASTVSGGLYNTASGPYSAVSGGEDNEASGYAASVSGGIDNEASGDLCASVSGGKDNVASGFYSTVSGGVGNVADTNGSLVP